MTLYCIPHFASPVQMLPDNSKLSAANTVHLLTGEQSRALVISPPCLGVHEYRKFFAHSTYPLVVRTPGGRGRALGPTLQGATNE